MSTYQEGYYWVSFKPEHIEAPRDAQPHIVKYEMGSWWVCGMDQEFSLEDFVSAPIGPIDRRDALENYTKPDGN